MWDEMYETMLYEDEDMESAPPPTAAQLNAFEQKFDFRLPQSYREFITRFGPGSIEIWYEFPSPECQESTWDLTRMNEAENVPAYVLFARLWSNGSFCWAREQVTNEDGPEYAIYYLERLGDAIRLCDSFEQFFEEFCLFNGHERIMPEIEIDAARLFSPLTLRAKQKVLRERAPSSGRDPLEEIRELAPPPEEPRCATGDWEALETELGLQLPNEYRAYYSLYGAGRFNGYLIVHPAFDELGFMSWVEENIDEIAEYQHATYPSPGGLLPCAQTLDGDGIYWLTEGEPDSWTIVYQEGLNTFYEIDTGLVQFIADVLSRRSELIPDVLPGCRFSNPAFEVARPHVEQRRFPGKWNWRRRHCFGTLSCIILPPAFDRCPPHHMKTILLYCQNMLGTGHFVRMSLLARGLAKQYKVFLIDGGRPVSGDRPGPGITRVELPRICSRNGKVTPVDSAAELPALMAARRRRLESVCRKLQPDAIIVEHFPLGKWFLRDEVLPLIQLARQLNPRMLVLSSIRDLVATNELVPSHLRGDLFLRLLNTSFDGLLIHSDPQFIRLDDHLPWAAEIRVPSYYTGFIREEAQPVLQPPDSTGILVSAGGNGGAQLRRCSIEAWKLLHRAPDVSLENMTILLALHHDQEELQYLKQLVGNCPIRIEPFSAQFVPLLQRTRLSISQAGYNTCANLLATLTRAVLVSHTAMGDQALRVRRFAERGLATVISPDDLTGPSLAEAIRHALLLPAPRHDIDLNGVHRSCDVISQLLSGHGMDSKRISTLL